MSVRMALAKLCACTAGGAIVGGGAVHVSEAPAGGPAEVRVTQPRVAARTIGNRPRVHRKTRQVRPVRQTCAPTPTVVTVTNQIATPAPVIPPPPVPIIGELPSFGGGGAPAVIGGGGFFGGGGGFFGGFSGGSSGGGGFFVREGDIVIKNQNNGSTSTGGSNTAGSGATGATTTIENSGRGPTT